MPPSTLYSVQNRLKHRGYILPPKQETINQEKHDLHDLINQYDDLSWAEANEIFEREIMHYLYEKYGYNKYRMANILKLSYPSIIDKTRTLTQVDEYFLAN